MKWFKSTRGRGRARSFVPRVEGLEEREVPVANFTVSGSTLTISAPTTRIGPALNRIVIDDTGSAAANNVTAAVNGARFRPNVPINSVIIKGGAGRELVTYNMTGSLVGSRTVDAGLAGGADSFKMTVRRDFTSGSLMSVNVRGGDDVDVLSLTLIGKLPANASMS